MLPEENSLVYSQLLKTQSYANENDMKINFAKTKLMLFNTCKKFDFMPNFELDGNQLELIDEMRLLGVVITSDLKWNSNTCSITSKAYKRLWFIRRLKQLGVSEQDLIDLYTKQVRCLLEYAVPVWHSSVTEEEKQDIERVQKSALRIILGQHFESYSKALETTGLQTLEHRRQMLCERFALSAQTHPKHKYWFQQRLRSSSRLQGKYLPVIARTERLRRGPITYMTNLLNRMKK